MEALASQPPVPKVCPPYPHLTANEFHQVMSSSHRMHFAISFERSTPLRRCVWHIQDSEGHPSTGRLGPEREGVEDLGSTGVTRN